MPVRPSSLTGCVPIVTLALRTAAPAVDALAQEAPSVPVASGAAPELDTVTVQGNRDTGYRQQTKRASLGPLGKRALLDTPYSLNVIPGEMLENQQAHRRKNP